MSVEWVAPVIAPVITGAFGLWIAKITTETRRQVTPSNGTKTATQVENIAWDVAVVKHQLAEHLVEANADRAAFLRHLGDHGTDGTSK